MPSSAVLLHAVTVCIETLHVQSGVGPAAGVGCQQPGVTVSVASADCLHSKHFAVSMTVWRAIVMAKRLHTMIDILKK